MRPENHGKLWTNEETTQLMKEIKLINIKEIAIIHKRTENAIFLKLIRHAAKLSINDNKLSLYDLSIITSLKISNIIQGFKKINYKKFIDNDNDNDNDNEYRYNYKYYLIIPVIIIISVMSFWRD